MAESSATSVTLTRTGKMVRFLDLRIGEAFYAHGAFWTRTDTHKGTDLRQRPRTLDEPAAETFGSCHFGVKEDTLMVEAVSLSFA